MPTALNASATVAATSSINMVNDVSAIDFATMVSIGETSETGTCGSTAPSALRTLAMTPDALSVGAFTTRCICRYGSHDILGGIPAGGTAAKYASSIGGF